MNILLLGNGYDLNYKLPTSYRNFLLTIDFLTKCDLENIHSVDDVFGNADLQKEDKFIAESYEMHKGTYAAVTLDTKTLHALVEQAKRNIWFSYFLKSFNREAGWIDVEREIAFVVSHLQSFFDKADVTFLPSKACDEIGSKYIIMDAFNFFVADAHYSRNALPTGARKIKPEYTVEYPLGSGDHVINKEKIINELRDALNVCMLNTMSAMNAKLERMANMSYEYKVVAVDALYTDAERPRGHLSGDFLTLEELLNKYSQSGWQLDRIQSAPKTGNIPARNLVIFRKEKMV